MGCLRVTSRIIPNFFVISLATSLLVCSDFVIIPGLIRTSPRPIFWWLAVVVVLSGYAMWLWCWMVIAVGDPGSIAADLRRRGVLLRLRRGDIPRCVRHLSFCHICNLPRPPNSYHCSTCGACFLRHDHHCGVTGQCVGDRNFKAFVLNFVWGGIFGFVMFPPAAVSAFVTGDVIAIVIAIYSAMLGVMLLAFGASFLSDSLKSAGTYGEGRMTLGVFLRSFGDKWWKKWLPIQEASTFMAWPGVDWSSMERNALSLL
jgi:hypothetical protein